MYSRELISFVCCLAFGVEATPITLEDAQYDIDEWRKEGMDVLEDFPSDLTAESYMDIWNSLVCD